MCKISLPCTLAHLLLIAFKHTASLAVGNFRCISHYQQRHDRKFEATSSQLLQNDEGLIPAGAINQLSTGLSDIMSSPEEHLSKNQLLYIIFVTMASMTVALVVSRSSTLGRASKIKGKITRWAAAYQRLEHDSECRMKEDAARNNRQKCRVLRALHSHSPSPGFPFEPMYAKVEGMTSIVRLRLVSPTAARTRMLTTLALPKSNTKNILCRSGQFRRKLAWEPLSGSANKVGLVSRFTYETFMSRTVRSKKVAPKTTPKKSPDYERNGDPVLIPTKREI